MLSFPYNESRHDSYPQFPRSSLGTRGLQTRSHRKKKPTAFYDSRFAKASKTSMVRITGLSLYANGLVMSMRFIFSDRNDAPCSSRIFVYLYTRIRVFIHAFLSFRFHLVKPSTVHILDGMAKMQMVESSGATFGDLFLKYFDILTTPLSHHHCRLLRSSHCF